MSGRNYSRRERREPHERTPLDSLASSIACWLLTWSRARLAARDVAGRAWMDALAGELEEIDGGWARLVWATGGLRLVWLGRRGHLVRNAYRFSPVLLIVAGAALLADLGLILARQYTVIALILGILTAIGVVILFPLLLALAWSVRAVARRWLATRHVAPGRVQRVWSRLALGGIALCLVALVALGMVSWGAVGQVLAQGPDTAGVVASAADHYAVESALNRTPGLARPDVYLTTLVKPLAINDTPLALPPAADSQTSWDTFLGQPICDAKASCPPMTTQEYTLAMQELIGKFTSIQGFDLAHGQLPHLSDFDGEGGGRQLAAGDVSPTSDANGDAVYNVIVPASAISFCPNGYQGYCGNHVDATGDVITVQSQVTGQIVKLRIIGQYWIEDGNATPLFGTVLADDSLVRLLSGGDPSYAYGLRVDPAQRQALFSQLRAAAPSAQLYDFSRVADSLQTGPAYTHFTTPNTEETYYAFDHAPELLRAALATAVLVALLLAANREACRQSRRRRRTRTDPSAVRSA